MQGYAQPQQPPAPQQPQQFAPQPTVPQPPAPQGFPMQQGAYPVAPPQGYAPPQQPYGYPPAQMGYPMAPPAPQPQFAAPTLESFFGQPTVGWGPSWQFNQTTAIGTTYVGVVARAIGTGDIENQTGKPQFPGQPAPIQTYADGRPKQVMKVPMLVQPDMRFTEGRAVFFVQGTTRDELARAMSAAGAPEGPPEAGATIQVTKASEYRNSYGTMSARLAITYTRPNGAAPVQPPAAPAPQQQAPVQQYAPQAQAPQQAPVQQYAPPQQAPQQAAPPAQPPAPGPAPTGLDAAQQQVLAGLLGQQG